MQPMPPFPGLAMEAGPGSMGSQTAMSNGSFLLGRWVTGAQGAPGNTGCQLGAGPWASPGPNAPEPGSQPWQQTEELSGGRGGGSMTEPQYRERQGINWKRSQGRLKIRQRWGWRPELSTAHQLGTVPPRAASHPASGHATHAEWEQGWKQ